MLVADVGEVADAVDVVPEGLGGEILERDERGLDAGLSTVEVADAAGGTLGDLAVGSEGGGTKKGRDDEFHSE